VAPDVEVPAEEALATAYNAVLDVLLERAESEEARRRLEWARKEFEAGQNPTVLSREQLAEYCGTYETRSFSVSEAGVLQYHRDGESSFPMVPWATTSSASRATTSCAWSSPATSPRCRSRDRALCRRHASRPRRSR